MLIKVSDVEALSGFRLRLTFSDGSRGIYDCASILESKGTMVEPLRNLDYFDRVFLEFGAPTWPDGYDLAPCALQAELGEGSILQRSSEDAA